MPDIAAILQNTDLGQIVSTLCVDTLDGRNPQEYLDEYKGKRERRDDSVDNREDKQVDIYSDTETEEDEDGNQIPKKIGTETITVAKVHTNYPKKIVRTAANFLFGGEMSVTFSEQNEGADYFRNIWEKKLRMKSVLKKFTRTVMVETKAALLFYPRVTIGSDGKEVLALRVRLLSIENSEIYPHFDEYGDMDAFVRKYMGTNPDDGKEMECVTIYTADQIIQLQNIGGSWVQTNEPNLVGIIPVVYVEIEQPEWEDIVTVLDRLELRLSRLSDTNDYFAEPILKSYGATNLPSKKTVGKQIEFEMEVDDDGNVVHGDADYLTWQQTVESIKLELTEFKNEIHSGTSTPDLTFDNIKSIGNVTGIGMKLMFIDAFLKREDNMEIFEPAIQRCISVVRNCIINVTDISYKSHLEDNEIDVEFGSILPDDLREEMEILAMANGNKPINSRRTVTARSRFTKNSEEEYDQIMAEEKEEAANTSPLGMTL